MKVDESNELEIVYDNMWTKLGLDGLRGSSMFKGIWRGARVAFVIALTAMVNNYTEIAIGFGVPAEYLPILAVIIEKLAREYIPVTEF